MEPVYLEDRLPVGFCADCCSRMAKGEMRTSGLELRKDLTLVSAYCSHNEAGATLLVGPGRPQRWQIVSPIDAVEWEAFVAIRAQSTRDTLAITRWPEVPPEKLN